MVTVNNLFAHWIKEINVTIYRDDVQKLPTSSPCKIYQYSDAMLKDLYESHSKQSPNYCILEKKK